MWYLNYQLPVIAKGLYVLQTCDVMLKKFLMFDTWNFWLQSFADTWNSDLESHTRSATLSQAPENYSFPFFTYIRSSFLRRIPLAKCFSEPTFKTTCIKCLYNLIPSKIQNRGLACFCVTGVQEQKWNQISIHLYTCS